MLERGRGYFVRSCSTKVTNFMNSREIDYYAIVCFRIFARNLFINKKKKHREKKKQMLTDNTLYIIYILNYVYIREL